ncbi:DUF294 nucleotidyltransferase-like domain-containing protein [Anoxybacillus rupiensis]|uniref:DUF294 nucleotidyltransferase-like domain-containing protein n=1 Tax=Anoxybacteroides rupiense TaxID=311460 RepID=A0ABT5W2K4_9BACL|nr:DUF294 nucleotidyltransferase-like domain-containing protein [Anoxybacillus rupiensis]MDE8563558.1 DUF294 nucleotidyltransferase-like domain-containing protein [Anoxybacillus rupiensis]
MRLLKDLIKQINQAKTVEELGRFHQELAYQLRGVTERERIPSLSYVLSDVHDAIMKQAIALAEKAARRASVGRPPARWCWYAMGSIGRGEPTVWTDQDHGILFECAAEAEEECYIFIRYLAEIGTKYLYEMGYPYCTGNVMATNRRWSQSLRHWQEQIATYIDHHFPDDIRFLLIAMDMRPIYGASELVVEGKRFLIDRIHHHSLLLKRIGEHVIFPRVPLGWFGNFQLERWGPYSGCLHLKYSGYVQLVNALKFLACQGNIAAMRTRERLEEISAQLLLPVELVEAVREAFFTYAYFRLKYSLAIDNNEYVSVRILNRNERIQLKQAMKISRRLQRLVMRRAGD